ncbi:MAG TPA: FAA hydrolase family protein [Persephonella sp.]|uniref:Fumarylacetoacetate hydrolase n=1 Tax=Persephonella marina (strain DSM 14350 / EX-H1) TaxID=123214 RepID=C0QRK2_PERMH|nr:MULTISPECIES: fumarylacetoacetate hydrolase family protein [Persephonella]ACO04395.1 fumarylacetoacetate hydrolase [Persephonella marina EX-H1]HCB69043.1 FAA hydrolase family protein [Persephonella sp.]
MKRVVFDSKEVFPSKIICVGRNYTDHIRELGNKNPEEIVLFIKPNSSISDILLKPDERCRYEGEISFIFKDGQIAGVGLGIDLTLIDVQKRLKEKGLPWEKSKAFDNSAVFSDFVRVDSIDYIRMELWINGKLRQSGSVSQMIYSVDQIVNEIKRYFSINDYDILMCGTPEGVGEFEKGDIFIGKIFSGDKLLTEGRWTAE